jgi:hypothetical protein
VCDDHTMLRSLDISAVLSGVEEAHRAQLYFERTMELSLDCFVCERVGRTMELTWGAERAVCRSGRDEHHFAAARIAAFDVTLQDDRLALRSVVDFWWAPFQDAKRGEQARSVSWVRLHYGCYCPHQKKSGKSFTQTNVVRPRPVYCEECKTKIAVDAEVPSIRLLV